MKNKTEVGSCGHKFLRPQGYTNKECLECLEPHHTPIPWELGQGNSREIYAYQDDDNQNDVMVAICESSGTVKLDEERANAAFIVLAVNNFDNMKMFLSRALQIVETDYSNENKMFIEQLKDTIAKAEGK